MKDIRESALEIKGYLVSLRRELHRRPELALHEENTAKIIERELDALGISHTRVGATGVLAAVNGGRPGRTVALRADIDALPIVEESGVDFASEIPGVMHACGHDVHTAALIGAAGLLNERKNDFSGEARFFFQPAEETGFGADDFINAGAMEGVYRVFGLHCAPDLPIGSVSLTPGLNNVSVDEFRIKLHGRAAHVSTPHLGADALYAASQLVVALQGLVSRRTSPTEPIVIGVGTLNAGTAYNAVAEYAELSGTTRTVSNETRMATRGRIEETARNIAAISGVEAEVYWEGVCSALINDPAATREAQDIVSAYGGLAIVADRPLSMCGDNFAEYQLRAPGVYAFLGTANDRDPNTRAGIHNGHFDVDENALPIAAALHTVMALSWLK